MTEPVSRIAVLGANGQLGRDLMEVLNVRFTVAGFDLPELDIAGPDSISRNLDPLDADVIVNAAAYTAVDRCESDLEAARRVNAEGPRLLALYAQEYGKRFVHVSTDYVFDGRRPPPEAYRETDPPAPRTAYGQTKLEGEQHVREACERAVIVRTAWLYGRHGRNFLKGILRRALQDPGRPLKIVDDQHGCPTWSRRLAEQIDALIGAAGAGVYHAVGEGHCTWYAFARVFLELMNVPHAVHPCTTAEYPTPAARPANSILENARLKEENLNRMRDWRDDLEAFVAAYGEALLAEAREEA